MQSYTIIIVVVLSSAAVIIHPGQGQSSKQQQHQQQSSAEAAEYQDGGDQLLLYNNLVQAAAAAAANPHSQSRSPSAQKRGSPSFQDDTLNGQIRRPPKLKRVTDDRDIHSSLINNIDDDQQQHSSHDEYWDYVTSKRDDRPWVRFGKRSDVGDGNGASETVYKPKRGRPVVRFGKRFFQPLTQRERQLWTSK